MNTLQKAIDEIDEFLKTDERCLLLTGTYQNKKHILALAVVIERYLSSATILFRANSVQNVNTFLSPVFGSKNFSTGRSYTLKEGFRLSIDSINSRSWGSTPSSLDIAIVYPIDSLKYDEGDECVHDLLRRGAKKIFLVSWTDNKDFSWTNQFSPVHVVYDAEEEDPEYHKRMLDIIGSSPRRKQLKGLPDYARTTPEEYLIQFHCEHCRHNRWARLNMKYPGATPLKNTEMGIYRATCLVCGNEENDNYNWYR
jgi:hypothetical protein